jgi:broad specificity phosphatase PhoE
MVASPTRIYLLRHGEVHNPERILYGRLPRFGLNEAGRAQARAAARWLEGRPLAALFSSPMLRARQTALAVAQRRPGLPLHISSWLNEVHTRYQGRPGAELDARGGDVYTGSGTGYEQPEDLVVRAKKFALRVRKRYAGRQVAAVTHGDIVTFTALWALGFDLTPKNKTRLLRAGYPVAYPGHASITTLTFYSSDSAERPGIDYHQPI